VLETARSDVHWEAGRAESPENREACTVAERPVSAKKRKNGSPEVRDARRAADRLAKTNKRAKESHEARDARLAVQRTADAKKRANETPEDKEARLTANRAAQSKARDERLKSLMGNDEIVEDHQAAPPDETGLMKLQDLVDLETTHNLEELTDEKLAAILERLKHAMSDLALNVNTCVVCDMFKKRKFFQPGPIDLLAASSAHLRARMIERLHFEKMEAATPSNPKLPEPLLAEVTAIGATRVPDLAGVILSSNGLVDPLLVEPAFAHQPAAKVEAYFCKACYTSLLRPCKSQSPPKYAMANNLVIGTCPLDVVAKLRLWSIKCWP
jgi:hypothetical protein